MDNGNAALKAQEIILKVGKLTNPGSLKTAIIGHLRDGKVVYLDCIGVAANYIATKAIIMVRGQMLMVGKSINYVPIFLDVIIDSNNSEEEERRKTAIRWEITNG